MNVVEKYLTSLTFDLFVLIKPIIPASSKSFWNNFPLAEAKATPGSKISQFFKSYLHWKPTQHARDFKHTFSAFKIKETLH